MVRCDNCKIDSDNAQTTYRNLINIQTYDDAKFCWKCFYDNIPYLQCSTCKFRIGTHSLIETKRCGIKNLGCLID